ncbi:radical SAM protein [Spirochaetia bacterium]|nr:radical SAM protein [Spirochaetia bacterium]
MNAPVCLIQPPFTQLNTPYPSLYYLKTFLEQQGHRVIVRDHSIGLFEKIFCRAGLERIFDDAIAGQGQSSSRGSGLAQNPIAERFFSEADHWINMIDRLISFLRGRDREWGHFLTLANGVLPGGPRFDACLENFGGSPLPEDAPLLAGKLLADLADFITQALDPNFSLVRYSGNTGAGLRGFDDLKQSLDGYILKNFYRPYLEEEWDYVTGIFNSSEGSLAESPLLIGLTIPFPGCLAGALACGASAKLRFGGKAAIIAGGGYVNTELRFMDDPRIFDYVDYLSFDRGYGSWEAILDQNKRNGSIIYKTMYRSEDGKIIADPAIICGGTKNDANDFARFRRIDDESIKTVFPDYRDVDFSRYLYPVDDVNPMHRLWSDGHWLKAYLAHGCYWHACAFCDITLDYIRSFVPTDTAALFHHLVEQAEQTGVHGVHLVDEAAPVSSLLRLAQLNRDAGLPLTFWGNIRFEKGFTPDTAAILAAGGLVGISAGIEVATEAGFKRIGKGIGLEDVVRACAAFKEAGILTHAYLIYGYWDEDEQEIIDSAEILRQLFAAGLLDSAFWHQFVLTRHSRIYTEWEKGMHRTLQVADSNTAEPTFALNDLSFEGETQFSKYTEPLDRLLASWVTGDSAAMVPVTAAFPFKVKEPSVSADLVADILDTYARERDEGRGAVPGTADRVIFLGSRLLISGAGKNTVLRWHWQLGEHELKTGTDAGKIAALLQQASSGNGTAAAKFYQGLITIMGAGEAEKAWRTLREGGLTRQPPIPG